MTRMGHSTVRAAMIYQHLVGGRDQEIADHVDRLIKKSKKVKRPKGDGDLPDSDKIN
ncbi:integrase [Streptomyces lydicus]|uniref:integrase n=1 Tax=Streptomyces lydicus TaxID=47763 RepID=UPI0037A95B51